MPPLLRSQIHQEVDLIQRFAISYRRKFAELIERMNHAPASAPADVQCMRLCVEAVDMMLATQQQLASALARLSDGPALESPVPPLRPAA